MSQLIVKHLKNGVGSVKTLQTLRVIEIHPLIYQRSYVTVSKQ